MEKFVFYSIFTEVFSWGPNLHLHVIIVGSGISLSTNVYCDFVISFLHSNHWIHQIRQVNVVTIGLAL